MWIPNHSERKAAFVPLLFSIGILAPQKTARQNRLLTGIKGNRCKLLPVRHQRVLCEDIVQR